MSVHNRARNSKRNRRAFQIELEQAESLFDEPRGKTVYISGDFIHTGPGSFRDRAEFLEALRRGERVLNDIGRRAAEKGARPIPFVRTAHFR